jgi:hypothetical protein
MTAKLTKTERKELNILIADLDNARSALLDRLDEIANEWDDAISEKSDRWQESDAGSDATSRAETIRQWVDEVPETPAFDFDEVS